MKKTKKVVKLRKKSIGMKIKECILSSFILLCSFILILLFSPIFNIIQVNVEGNSKLNENFIRSESGIRIGHNILRLNKIKIKEELLKISYIEDVTINRKWPDTIVIKVKEKEPLAKISLLGSSISLFFKFFNISKNFSSKS